MQTYVVRCTTGRHYYRSGMTNPPFSPVRHTDGPRSSLEEQALAILPAQTGPRSSPQDRAMAIPVEQTSVAISLLVTGLSSSWEAESTFCGRSWLLRYIGSQQP